MQKLLPVLAFLFVAAAVPAIAAQNNGNSNCDPAANWKNHGQYVSCVAHTHPGGQVVSQAAQSDIGKKSSVAPSPSASPSVSPSPNASPEVSPSPSVEPSPSPSASPEPSASPTPEASPTVGGITTSSSFDILGNLIEKLEELIERLENLF